ncbi:NALCN channel auxiliary factor 1-like [Nothobranchius furzeri]|uniref:NALCN channel auxiliary factor 1-like n=1 Tax=Nothobranchius furzeri TaxID=105023 RepID=UPI0024048079|nr:NALCN channel auxiliary factor 1-like [Nothobranchius furzeri]
MNRGRAGGERAEGFVYLRERTWRRGNMRGKENTQLEPDGLRELRKVRKEIHRRHGQQQQQQQQRQEKQQQQRRERSAAGDARAQSATRQAGRVTLPPRGPGRGGGGLDSPCGDPVVSRRRRRPWRFLGRELSRAGLDRHVPWGPAHTRLNAFFLGVIIRVL